MKNRISKFECGQPATTLTLIKGGERYVFTYDDNHRAEVLRTLGRFAGNAELSFNWYDCACLSRKIRAEQESTSCD